MNGAVVIPIDASGGVGCAGRNNDCTPHGFGNSRTSHRFPQNGLYMNIHTGTESRRRDPGPDQYAATNFADVPATGFASTQIEAVAAQGITGGCLTTPLPFYCPTNSITRGQMAVFLETSLGVLAAPACAGTCFCRCDRGNGGSGDVWIHRSTGSPWSNGRLHCHKFLPE